MSKSKSKSKVVFLKKIVAKNLVQGKVKDVAKAIENDGESIELYKVVGKASAYKTGESNFGEWVSFQGSFEAYDNDGVIYKSNVAFVQEPLQTMIRDVLDKGDVDDVEFGLSVEVKRRDDLEVGYEYVISPLLEVQESDSLSHLRQLALPSATEEKEPAKTSNKK